MSRRRDNLREVETSPNGQYIRFDERLGNGAYKDVWLAFDNDSGKEVAWNTVDLRRLPFGEKRRIKCETEILQQLKHPHIINFHDSWNSPNKEEICFITEIVTSGTLKDYIKRVKRVKLKIIKKWCRQILEGLDYLHRHNPPIIHRDLKCDNIFINGSTSEIRIGDFGLSATRRASHVESVLGTPEFMAPELYEESYTEKVDIYAFGMCVLEMVTNEYPYQECNNAVHIWKRVAAGVKPEALYRIKDSRVRMFVELCLASEDYRLSARELLQHPFLCYEISDVRDHSFVLLTTDKPAEDGTLIPVPAPVPVLPIEPFVKPVVQPASPASVTSCESQVNVDPSQPPPEPLAKANPFASGARVTSTEVIIERVVSESVVSVLLLIHLGDTRKKQIKFEFDLAHDTAEQVAIEMVRELELPDPERTQRLIADNIFEQIERFRSRSLNGAPPNLIRSVSSPTPVSLRSLAKPEPLLASPSPEPLVMRQLSNPPPLEHSNTASKLILHADAPVVDGKLEIPRLPLTPEKLDAMRLEYAELSSRALTTLINKLCVPVDSSLDKAQLLDLLMQLISKAAGDSAVIGRWNAAPLDVAPRSDEKVSSRRSSIGSLTEQGESERTSPMPSTDVHSVDMNGSRLSEADDNAIVEPGPLEAVVNRPHHRTSFSDMSAVTYPKHALKKGASKTLPLTSQPSSTRLSASSASLAPGYSFNPNYSAPRGATFEDLDELFRDGLGELQPTPLELKEMEDLQNGYDAQKQAAESALRQEEAELRQLEEEVLLRKLVINERLASLRNLHVQYIKEKQQLMLRFQQRRLELQKAASESLSAQNGSPPPFPSLFASGGALPAAAITVTTALVESLKSSR